LKKKKFKAEVLSGHKEHALEVPFDPEREWGFAPKPLWRGRRGHLVSVKVNGSFAGAIVPRQKRFYLLIEAEAGKAAGVSEGAVVQVTVEPCVE
jgi:hypothetical protein